jgi:dsDNA-binding SOS-regulon protein
MTATLGRQLPLSPAQAIADYCARHAVSLTSEQRTALRVLLTDRDIDAEHRVLRTSRNEALQEAAVIARDYDEDHANRAVMRNTAAGIFERICALKS